MGEGRNLWRRRGHVRLAGPIPAGSISCPAVDALTEVFATVLASVQTDLPRVQSILPLLAPAGQSQFTALLGGLPAELSSLLATLEQAFACPSPIQVVGPTAGAGSLVAALGTVGSVTDSIAQVAESLRASFVPGIAAGGTPSPVAVPAPVSGLLSQVTSLIPQLGSLFGANSSSGLPGLGGLPGVAV